MSSNEENEMKGQEADLEAEGPPWCSRKRFFWKVPLFLILLLAKVGLVMVLWNYLVPDLFHLPTLDYVHTLGLMVLLKLMLGFHHHGGFKGRWGHHPMHKRWHRMSPEEREKLRETLRKRWGK